MATRKYVAGTPNTKETMLIPGEDYRLKRAELFRLIQRNKVKWQDRPLLTNLLSVTRL